MPNSQHPNKSPHRHTLRANMTESERRLWRRLREACPDAHFRRQTTIGRYIVDFVSFKHRLILELDGGQHCENPDDKIRDAWLGERGFRVLRFWNNEVDQNIQGVIEAILMAQSGG